uniref:Uncharacterized protein n=1 Tax=Zea mays TaxID=4577 RepID=A0A804LNR7_MAIZE
MCDGPSDDVGLMATGDPGCPLTPVEVLAEPVSLDLLAGPVDAPTLPCVAVEELAAPGVLALCDVMVLDYSPDGATDVLAAGLREDSILAVSCVDSVSSARWNFKPPVFKVYSRRLRPSNSDDQDDTLVQSTFDNSMDTPCLTSTSLPLDELTTILPSGLFAHSPTIRHLLDSVSGRLRPNHA